MLVPKRLDDLLQTVYHPGVTLADTLAALARWSLRTIEDKQWEEGQVHELCAAKK